jgi:hypothetical protein
MKLGREKNTLKQKNPETETTVLQPLLPVVFVLEFGHGHRFESLRSDSRMFVEVVQLLLAQVIDETGADRVTQDVDCRAESVKVEG